MTLDDVFATLPSKLRLELVSEFAALNESFLEGKWRSSGLNAGRFCEVAYCVVKGHADGSYPEETKKPNDLIGMCKSLESNTKLPHGFRLLVPRVLTILFEIRNNRNISHVGGEVDPSFMDASLVLSNAKWVMAEFVRELHHVSETKAQSIVDNLSQYTPPSIWADDKVRRVLDNKLTYDEKLIVLLASSGGQASKAEIFTWIDHGTQHYFAKRLALLHAARQIETKAYGDQVKLLPPGNKRAMRLFETT